MSLHPEIASQLEDIVDDLMAEGYTEEEAIDIVAGVGVPQLTAIMDATAVAAKAGAPRDARWDLPQPQDLNVQRRRSGGCARIQFDG